MRVEMLEQVTDQDVEHALEGGVVGSRHRSVEALAELLVPVREQPGDELLAVGEVVVERADGDAGGGRDVLHARAQPLPGEHVFGGLEDALARHYLEPPAKG